jgi:hypothetical protein
LLYPCRFLIISCWGILEQHWNGAKLIDAETMLAWSNTMTWKGSHPVVMLNHTLYEKGVTLSDSEMKEVNSRLKRNPALENWDILIKSMNG